MKLFLKPYSLFILLALTTAHAQQDSISKPQALEEIVVTGQYNPQSVRKSVFQVTVLTRNDIDRQAGNNLADLLNQTLNINIIPNALTGKSGVQLFGLDSQYFKILIDNIPVINDEGLGNNTDLTQINLDDIQQIEIVEGSMGVEYGANAVSGIINIITRKSSKYKWEITPYLQEETIGSEYNLADQGRHIQSLKVGHNFNSKLFGNAVITANDFKGFYNDKQGENYTENDGLRGYEWLPKKQLNVKSLLNYSLKKHRFFYKFEYFREITDKYNSEVRPNYNPATETTDPTASDQIFTSNRFYHHLNASGKFENNLIYDLSLSYQQQKRDVETYNYRIRAQEKSDVKNFGYESQKGFYSKGKLSNFFKTETVDFQAGYEISAINGFSSAYAGTFEGSNISRTLGSYDLFGSSEINLSDKISIRPGIRALFSSQFDTQAALSLSAKFQLKNGFELRGIIGTAPRLPNYEELYTYFVDVNHDVRGNPDLKPEQGASAFVHLNKENKFKDNSRLNSKFSMWFIDVKDRIELVIINQNPLAYQYANIDVYKTWGMSLTEMYAFNKVTVSGGITFSGVSKVLDSQEDFNDDYLYGFQANANMSYNAEKWNTVFSMYLKYNGPAYQFVGQQQETGTSVLVRGKQDAFTWLDATARKSLLKNKLELTVGVRNLFDITTINTSAVEGVTHNGPPANILMGYGRSAFLKVLYKLNF